MFSSGRALLLRDTQRGLTFMAVGMLSLLALGIRNSWAIAIEIVSTRPGRHQRRRDGGFVKDIIPLKALLMLIIASIYCVGGIGLSLR